MCQTGELPCSENYVKILKEKIRTTLHTEDEHCFYTQYYFDEEGYCIGDPDWCTERISIFHDNGSGYIKKYRLPIKIKSKKMAENFYNEYIYKTATPVYYDCSNQEFSFNHAITYNTNDDRFYVYERVLKDV